MAGRGNGHCKGAAVHLARTQEAPSLMEEVDIHQAQSAILQTQHTTKETEPRPHAGCQAAAVAPCENVTGQSPPPTHPHPTLP